MVAQRLTPAPLPWQFAARRLLDRVALVIFSRRLDNETLGKAYHVDGNPVIEINAGLSPLMSIRVLFHEAAHLDLEDCPDYKLRGGRVVKTWPRRPIQRVGHGYIYQAEDDLYSEFLKRLDDLKSSIGRPAGYWESEGHVMPGVADLSSRYEADLLSCVY
jgi:hypothetical protein